MKKGFAALVRAKSKKSRAGAEDIGPNTARHEVDRIGLAYQVQAAEQARVALRERVEEGKKFEENWMRLYASRGSV